MVVRKAIILVAVCFMLSWITPLSASSEEVFNQVHVGDAVSVADAIDSIQNTLTQQGFDIIGVIDHAANAASIGMNLRPTQLILFSDKRWERKLIRSEQTLAIEFPLKFLVWEDEEGAVNLFYNGPGYLADRHRLRLHDFRLMKIAQAVRQFGELENGLITMTSPFTVEQTVANLKNAIEALADKGFRVPFIIDFTSDDEYEGSHIPSATLIIFGNPNVGTPLMQDQQRIGVDLPQKFLVWEDYYGQTHITYNDIFFLAKRHNLLGVAENLESISSGLANFVKVATQQQ